MVEGLGYDTKRGESPSNLVGVRGCDCRECSDEFVRTKLALDSWTSSLGHIIIRKKKTKTWVALLSCDVMLRK